MISIEQIRKSNNGILAIGMHAQTIQSILDFDFLAGKEKPSVIAIVGGARKTYKFFFGENEMLIPCFADISLVPDALRARVQWMLNTSSGRRVFDSTLRFFEEFPKACGGHIFAENVPERHATELIARFGKKYIIAGPSGVGLCVAGYLKLGVVGGTDMTQLERAMLAEKGSVAVVSTSGGMTNELIHAVVKEGRRISFAFAIGGERFPVTSLKGVLSLAQEDSSTRAIVYFGELGGTDEYEIAEMLEQHKLTKPIVCYIAGVIDEAFDEHVQFGHAKALVAHKDESTRAKRSALLRAGASVPDTFPKFLQAIAALPFPAHNEAMSKMRKEKAAESPLGALRRPSILSTREIVDLNTVPKVVHKGKLTSPQVYAFAHATLKALLGHDVSDKTAAFVEHIFQSLIDHGGAVSGAVNTMITARAGKDMVSSLVAGLLTIGPRFGGAINDAARAWSAGVAAGTRAADFVEHMSREKKLLSGIGHKKYRVGLPDPRVESLAVFADLLKKHPHYDFARAVERITTGKSVNLILNVDGMIAALLLDLLIEEEDYSAAEVQELLDAEFFNALFIIPRSVGFIAHFLEQKKNDEGLFRLPDELLHITPHRKR